MNLKQWKENLKPGMRLRCVYRWYWNTSPTKPAPAEGFEMCEITTVRATQLIMKTPTADRSWLQYPRASELKATTTGFELYFPDDPKFGENRQGKLMSRYEYVTEGAI